MNECIVNGIRLRFVTGRMVGVKEMGHVCFCRPLEGQQPDAISAVANTGGFVSCTAVAKFLDVRPACLLKAVRACNEAQRIHVLKPCAAGLRLHGAAAHAGTPVFILTPRPPDYRVFDEEAASRLMTEVLEVCAQHRVQVIRLTQFCMLFEPLPLHHLRGVRRAIENQSGTTTLKQIVFDLDERHATVLYETLMKEEVSTTLEEEDA